MKHNFFIFLILFFFACSNMNDPKKNDNNQVYNDKELSMINGMNAIIESINKFDISAEEQNFYQEKIGDYSKKPVYLFGEEHNDVISQKKNLAFINHLALKGGSILLEGDDKKESIPISSCGLYLVYKIYINEEWAKKNKIHNEYKKPLWLQNEKFFETLLSTIKIYDISKLNLSKLKCSYWDDEESLKKSINVQSLEAKEHNSLFAERNKSMTIAIKQEYNSDNLPIFVIAGYLHLPLGEALMAIKKIKYLPKALKVPSNTEEYFNFIKTNLENFNDENMFISVLIGTTQVIHDFFKSEKIPYYQFINKSIIKHIK